MRRLVVVALLLAACTSTPTPTSLSACDWNGNTQTGFLPSFKCLDGGVTPAGMPSTAIVNVWGSWCSPCRKEIPYFITLDQKYETTIIGVDVDEPKIKSGQDYAMKSGMTWPNLFDANGESTSVFGPGVPVTWFIKDGMVVYKKIGAWNSYSELEKSAKKFGMVK